MEKLAVEYGTFYRGFASKVDDGQDVQPNHVQGCLVKIYTPVSLCF